MEHKNIAVFCGSSMGVDPLYEEKAVELANTLSDMECDLVYGAGSRGIMRAVA